MPNVIGPSFLVSGIAPRDVFRSPMARRRAFWGAVATYVLEAKERELRAGLDRFGNPLAHLAQSTIKRRKSEMGPAHAYAPPLMPAYNLSRTRSLFTAEPNDEATGVLCWWLYDAITGASWGEILEKHRAGSDRLPKRDVIGLTPASLAKVKQQATRWWESGREKVPKFRPTGVEPGVTHALPTGEWRRNLPPGTKGMEWLKPSETGVPRTMAAPARSVQTFRIGRHTYTLQGSLGMRPPSPPGVFPFGPVAPFKPKPISPKPVPSKPVPKPMAILTPRVVPSKPKPEPGLWDILRNTGLLPWLRKKSNIRPDDR